MFKQSSFLVLVLGLLAGTAIHSQDASPFTVSAPGKMQRLPADFEHRLQNATGLGRAEIEALLDRGKFSRGWNAQSCPAEGGGVQAPSGYYLNGTFHSVAIGCERVLLSPHPDLRPPVTELSGYPSDTCLSFTAAFHSVGCASK